MSLKQQIEEEFNHGNIDRAKELMDEYELACPQDLDLVSMKTNYYLAVDDIEQAASWALTGVRRAPLNADMCYNLAYIYELIGDMVNAYICYYKAMFIYSYTKNPKETELGLKDKTTALREGIIYQSKHCETENEREKWQEIVVAIFSLTKSGFGLQEAAFGAYVKTIGTYYYEDLKTKKYVGIYKDQFLFKHQQQEEYMNLIHMKGEFLAVREGTGIELNDTEEQDASVEYLIPIAAGKDCTVHMFENESKKHSVAQYHPNHFNWYRIKNHTVITSSDTSYYGSPVKLKMKPGKKKLVLSIFVDGLCQAILYHDDFRENMPYTYEFFKKGTICDRAYNTAEWTYPSIANYVTGLDTTHHMLFHNKLDSAMPKDVPTLPEYFQRDGYFTAKFCGNWRIIPAYGHARGYDRFVYQHQKVGFKVHEVISETINHISAFQDVNQYLWLSIGDLHDIADADDLPVEVQRDLPIERRTVEERGITSAKQVYSANKSAQYIREAKYIDRWLHVLYSYIEENYEAEDVIISLFSDHGQGYLIDRDAHFLSKERSNVAFMFRGGLAEGKGRVQDIVSTSDYSSIMRALAGIKLPEVPTDGILPRLFGGETDRAWALTESMHPQDSYQAVIFAEQESFFFVNPAPVMDDGRFALSDYTYWLEDSQGNRMENEAACRRYLDIILEHIAPLLIYK